MQLLGKSDVLSFVRIRQLNWIGHVNRMGCKRKASQVFDYNPQGIRPRNRGWNFVKTYINKHKITNSKKRAKAELTGRSPLRRRRFGLVCSAI